MADSQILAAIRMWAAIAWADGMLAGAEAEGLRRLIRTADLTDRERHEAAAFLDVEVTLPDTLMTNLAPEARRGIYRAACRMAIVDHVFAEAEREMLRKLSERLGVPKEIAEEIEADVPGVAS